MDGGGCGVLVCQVQKAQDIPNHLKEEIFFEFRFAINHCDQFKTHLP